MIRILFFVAVVLALGLGFAWLADRPGEMILIWQGQRVETSLLVGLTVLAALLVAIIVVLWLLKAIFSSPDAARRFFRRRRRERGYEALSRGLIAAGAGDSRLARRMMVRARSLLKPQKEPLVHVLEAQTYMIEGRHDDARAKFEAMAEEPHTRALGLRGLYLEARRMGAAEAAQHYAERAVERAPHLPWAAQSALEYRTRDGNWDDAIRLVDKQRSARIIEKADADRKRAVLLTARARARLDAEPRLAANDAQEAVRLAPGFVPAAVTAAKALYRLNDLRRGSKVLEKIWKTNPHPEIADTYVRARIGDSVHDRLKRARKLEAIKPNHVESLAIVARAAYEAHDYNLARETVEAALRQHPREGYYLLMADIEEADTGDQGRVRHWMVQALRAERDPVWVADGCVSEEWAPISPVTGKLDAFVWKAPVEQVSGPQIEGAPRGTDPETAIRTLPPVRTGAGPVVDATKADTGKQPVAAGDMPKPAGNEPKAEAKVPETPEDALPPATSSDGKTAETSASPVSQDLSRGRSREVLGNAGDTPSKPASQPVSPAIAATAREAAAGSAETRIGEAHGGEGAVVIPLKKQETEAGAMERPSDAAKRTDPRVADAKAGNATAKKAEFKTPPARAQRPTSVQRSASGTSGDPADPAHAAREEQFLRQRIDDPGVREGKEPAVPGRSRFKLF